MTTFEQEITRAEEELRDLKTTQKRGLGTIRFFQKSQPIDRQGIQSISLQITVEIAAGEPLPAFLTIATPLGNVPIETTAGVYIYNYWFARASGTPFDVQGLIIATSSAKIESITVGEQ